MNRHLAAALVGMILSGQAHAQDNDDNFKIALTEIAKFAHDLCGSIPLEGNRTESVIKGEARAGLSSLMRKLADLGISGAAQYREETYFNVLQEDLAEIVKGGRDCKLSVWNDLKFKIINPDPQQDSRVTFRDEIVFSVLEFSVGKGKRLYAEITAENISKEDIEILGINKLTTMRLSGSDSVYRTRFNGIDECRSSGNPIGSCEKKNKEKQLTRLRPERPFVFRLSSPLGNRDVMEFGHINLTLLVRRENESVKRLDVPFMNVQVQ